MGDPLSALRGALQRGEKVELLENDVLIGAERMPRKTSTSFRSNRGTGQPYALDAIYFQYMHREERFKDLFASCEREGVDYIKLIDKQNLLDYLDGKIDTCANIPKDAAGDAGVNSGALRPITRGEQDTKATINQKVEGKEGRRPATESKSTKQSEKGKGIEQLGTLYERVSSMEREQRTRDSVMAVAGRDFTWLRSKLEQHIRKRKANSRKAVHRTNTHTSDNAAAAFDPRGDRYRVKHDRVWRETMGADFGESGINPSGSFIKPQPANAARSSSAIDHRRPNSSRPNQGKRVAPQEHPSQPLQKYLKHDLHDRRPIIVAPMPSRGVIVNAANLTHLIEKSEFYSIEAMKAMKTIVKPVVSARRDPGGNSRGAPAEYMIFSNVSRMRDNDWNRVVAVICSGQEWQFKHWPYRGGLPEIFRNIQGIYFHYDDESPNPKVKDWAVKKLTLSRNRRHMDSRVMTEFWGTIDKYIGIRKPFLHY